jgi:hypothetical protein
VTTEFERGAFECPDDPSYDDDVDTAIVVVVDRGQAAAAAAAVERCKARWWGIDGAGRHHDQSDVAFWGAQADNFGAEWHTAKYVSPVDIGPNGPEVYVDCQSLMPLPMQAAYRRVLVEELEAGGITEAVIRPQYADDD